MSGAEPTVAIRSVPQPPSRLISLASIPPVLVTRPQPDAEPGPPRRARLWDFNTNLHCSIIGTCLSTAELRQVLRKLDLAPAEATDHELHGTAVSMAGRHDLAAKLLNKALDQRHKLAVNQFAKANTTESVRALWREAVRRGEIPGAYWATLTHPATTRALISEAFGEVHMLSHLVGAANRADIRRLCQLEADKAELETKLDRQQRALHEAVVTRDARIRELGQALARRYADDTAAACAANNATAACPTDNTTAACAADAATAACAADNTAATCPTDNSAMLRRLVADLERRLAGETRRRAALDERLVAAQAATAQERSGRIATERAADALRAELRVIEASLAAETDAAPPPRLDSIALLYVGGRPHQVTHLRAAAEGLGAAFLHHDGGIENHPNLLPGLTSRADLVLFPVDCISHEAALAVKSLCQQAGKRFIPLRSASVTALLAALQQPEVTGLAEAAD